MSSEVPQNLPEEPPKKSLVRKWLDWNGSFLVLSILFHVLLLAVAAWLIVGIVGKRKEKMKFTAPPPAPAAQEHHVKPAKKTTSSAPPVMKRIASTAINPQIALPEVSMNSPSTDVMSKVMSGMGQSGLGAGASGGGGGLPSLAGLTAFGFKGGKGPGLVGTFYDFKQDTDHKPTPAAALGGNGINAHVAILSEFFKKGWDVSVLNKYYHAPDRVIAPQIMMPSMPSQAAPDAFGVGKEIKGLRWAVHYKGNVVAPRDGTFRFIGLGDDILIVSFDHDTVLSALWPQGSMIPTFNAIFPTLKQEYAPGVDSRGRYYATKGKWFHVEAGKSYEMQVICSEAYGGSSGYELMIQEKDDPRCKQFQLMQGVKLPDKKPGILSNAEPLLFKSR